MDRQVPTSHVTVFAGGQANVDPSPARRDLVIAADSGYDHAVAAGVPVDVLIGDLDSISPAGLVHAEANNVEIIRHDEAKDATDIELAFDLAVERGAGSIELLGGEGGDIGHLLGVATLISSERYEGIAIRWRTGSGVVTVVRPDRPLATAAGVGRGVSLVPVTDAEGVETTGLTWPLRNETLPRGTSRGLSNESNEDEIAVSVASGVLLVLVEGPPST